MFTTDSRLTRDLHEIIKILGMTYRHFLVENGKYNYTLDVILKVAINKADIRIAGFRANPNPSQKNIRYDRGNKCILHVCEMMYHEYDHITEKLISSYGYDIKHFYRDNKLPIWYYHMKHQETSTKSVTSSLGLHPPTQDTSKLSITKPVISQETIHQQTNLEPMVPQPTVTGIGGSLSNPMMVSLLTSQFHTYRTT